MIFFVLELQNDFFDCYKKLTQAPETVCLTFPHNDIRLHLTLGTNFCMTNKCKAGFRLLFVFVLALMSIHASVSIATKLLIVPYKTQGFG